jgi:D-aspartate ligase
MRHYIGVDAAQDKGAVPAVVICSHLNSLGIVRSLKRGGMPIYVADISRFGPAMWSRYSRPVVIEALYGPKLIDGLLRLRERLRCRPVLFATEEMGVFTISENREVLQQAYHVRLPPKEMIETLVNKARLQELAEQIGFPVPRSLVVNARTDIQRLGDLRYPVIIKPADRINLHLGKTERLSQAATASEAQTISERLLGTIGEFVVQEKVPGPDSNIYFTLFYCGRNRVEVAMFTGRKIRSDPPEIGSTALCVGSPETRDELESLTRSFLKQVDCSGMGSLEFKRDPVQDRFIMIEPTVARTDWQEEIATLCGVNIPLAAYRHELGLQEEPLPVPRGNVAWRESYAHLRSGRKLLPGKRIVDGYWRFKDPLPGLIFYAYLLLRTIYRSTIKPLLNKPLFQRKKNISI